MAHPVPCLPSITHACSRRLLSPDAPTRPLPALRRLEGLDTLSSYPDPEVESVTSVASKSQEHFLRFAGPRTSPFKGLRKGQRRNTALSQPPCRKCQPFHHTGDNFREIKPHGPFLETEFFAPASNNPRREMSLNCSPLLLPLVSACPLFLLTAPPAFWEADSGLPLTYKP